MKNLKKPSRRKRGFQMREAELSDVQIIVKEKTLGH